jgi:AcrR family transcriptional regulator
VSPRSPQASAATRAASRARILDAAGALFAEHGFGPCRVADVAHRAGMSPANVYWHFDSKEAVLRAILVDGLAAREAMTAAVAAEYGPARRKLEIMVDRTLAFYSEHARFLVIRAGLAGADGQDVAGTLGVDLPETERRTRAHVRLVLAEARSEGAILPTEPDLLVHLFFALFDGLLVGSGGRWPTTPPDGLRDATLRLLGYRPAG